MLDGSKVNAGIIGNEGASAPMYPIGFAQLLLRGWFRMPVKHYA